MHMCTYRVAITPVGSLMPQPLPSRISSTKRPGMSPECFSHNILNPFPIAGQLGHFPLFIITNKICFLATFVPLKGKAAHLGGRVHLQVVSTCLWRLKKRHNHSFGLIRSQAEPFIVWRKGELERRRFTLEPSFYFKVYLCEERQFIALFLKNSWPLLFSGAWRDLQLAVRTKGRVWLQPKKHRERRRGFCRSQLSLVWKPRTTGLSFRHESEVPCLGLVEGWRSSGHWESRLGGGCVVENRELVEWNCSLLNLEEVVGRRERRGKRGAVFGLMPWGIWPRLSS